MAPIETPLLKGGLNEEDQTSPTNYGSTGNDQGVHTAKESNVRTGNEQSSSTKKCQDARTKVKLAKSTGSKQDNSMITSQAARPAGGKDVIIAVNPNAWEGYRRMKLRYESSSMIKDVTVILLNIALVTANAYQLKLVLASDGGDCRPCFLLLVIAISLLIILETVAGALMFHIETPDIDNDQLYERNDRLSNAVGILACMVTFINYAILLVAW